MYFEHIGREGGGAALSGHFSTINKSMKVFQTATPLINGVHVSKYNINSC